MDAPASPAQSWLAARGWQPHAFQREVWQAIAEGASGLLHATTGSGKTYAVWLGVLQALLARHPPGRGAEPLRAIWLTPMRALAADTAKALAQPLADLAPAWTLGLRTGDGEILHYELVGAGEGDPARWRISISSPVGEAIAGRRAGDQIAIQTPRRSVRVGLVSVEPISADLAKAA